MRRDLLATGTNSRCGRIFAQGASWSPRRCSSLVSRLRHVAARRTDEYEERAVKGGAVTVVQRTSSDLRLNPHLHVAFLDGVYREDGAELTWQPLGHLQTREVGEVLERSVRRMNVQGFSLALEFGFAFNPCLLAQVVRDLAALVQEA